MFLLMRTCILVGIFCLHFVSKVNCRDIFQSSLSYMDVSVVKNNLWNAIAAEDLGVCAKKCAFLSSCRSFSYNWITKDCRGHSMLFTIQSEELIPEPGAQYFYRKTYVKPTTIPPTTEAITKKSPRGSNGKEKTDVSNTITVSVLDGLTLDPTTVPKTDGITSETTKSLLLEQFTTETSTAS